MIQYNIALYDSKYHKNNNDNYDALSYDMIQYRMIWCYIILHDITHIILNHMIRIVILIM